MCIVLGWSTTIQLLAESIPLGFSNMKYGQRHQIMSQITMHWRSSQVWSVVNFRQCAL